MCRKAARDFGRHSVGWEHAEVLLGAAGTSLDTMLESLKGHNAFVTAELYCSAVRSHALVLGLTVRRGMPAAPH
jgi:hypothetical protein